LEVLDVKSRKQISKEDEAHHTLADTLREEKKEHGQDVHDERPDHKAPQSGVGRGYPGREGGSR
jgi:hypothetical protein